MLPVEDMEAGLIIFSSNQVDMSGLGGCNLCNIIVLWLVWLQWANLITLPTHLYMLTAHRKRNIIYLSYAFKIIKSNFIFIKIKKVIDKQKHKKGEVLCASL